MKVQIEKERILMGENALAYYPYYFAIWKDEPDHRVTVKNTLSQWASALGTLGSSARSAVYLPYYLNDQSCRFLKAEIEGEDTVFTDILVRDDGYGMNLDDLSHVMYSEPEVIYTFTTWDGEVHDETPKHFGRYNAKEIIEALKNAEIAER